MCEIYSELTKQDTRTLAWLFVVNFERIFASCSGISIFQINTGWVLQLEFFLNYFTNSSPEENILCPFSKIYFSFYHARILMVFFFVFLSAITKKAYVNRGVVLFTFKLIYGVRLSDLNNFRIIFSIFAEFTKIFSNCI